MDILQGWLPPLDPAHLILYAFVWLLVLAAIGDLRRMMIPNAIPLALAGLYLAHGLLNLTALEMAQALAVALLVFCANTLLFAFRLMGGGDVKFMAAVALWAGLDQALPFVLVTTLAGGILALAMLTLATSPFSVLLLDFVRVRGGRRHYVLPYGLAIAFGGLYVAQRLFLSLTVS
ncbi:MAG: prepilin peptidase [Alphaproteobacteria bacterium]|nr:prepilin peptidase [Alphaproteobacteria bacterium]